MVAARRGTFFGPRAKWGAGLVVLALAALAFVALRTDDEATGTNEPGRPGTTSQGSETSPATLSAEGEVLEGWRSPEPAWLAPFRERLDARAAGWPTEHAAEAVERELGATLASWLAGTTRADAGLDAAFEGATGLLPAALEARFDDGVVRLFGPARPSEELLDAAGFGAELARWRASLCADPRAECRVVAVERRADGAFLMEVVVRVAAFSEGSSVQDLARWRAAFRVAPDGRAVRALRIEVVEFERAETSAALFDEATRAAFGGVPRFAESFLAGNDARIGAEDKLAGGDLVGSHGVAVGDVDGDGLEDVYVAMPGGLPNRLLLKLRNGTVRDVGPQSGLAFLDSTFGVLIVDLDGDGARDVVAAVKDGVVVGWNEGGTRFRARPLPADRSHRFYSLTAADADGDGDLDLYGCRYMAGAYVDQDGAEQVPTPYHDAENGAPNVFWRNTGERRFVDATAEVGLDENNTRFSLSSIWEDVDDDGDLDLYVTNDFGRNNLYRNDGGRFVDVAGGSAADDMAASMGATMSDVDRDGDLDLVVSNMYAPAGLRVSAQPAFLAELPELRQHYYRHALGNSLLLNAGDGRFDDATEAARIGPGGWSWGTKFVDFDNDGLDDLYVPNGFVSGRRAEDLESYFWRTVVGSTPGVPPATPIYDGAWKSLRTFMVVDGYGFNGRECNYAYLNLGGGRFADVSALSGADHADDGRCAATLDWNHDGQTDLVIRNRTGPALRLLLSAHPQAGTFVELELAGAAPNTDAVGARVELDARGETWRRTVYAGDGYLGSSSKRLHFGIGSAERVDALRVTWPDGTRQAFEELAAGRSYRLAQGGELLESTRVPFAPLPVESLPVASAAGSRSASRIVLFDRLPMAPIPFPLDGGGQVSIADCAGRPVLIVVGHFASEPSRAALTALARHAATAEAEVLAVALDDVGAARALLGAQGRDAARVVPGTQDALKALQLMLLETLGEFDGLALPTVFVLDRAGRLAAIHQAPLSPDAVLADARAADGPRLDGVVGPVDPLAEGVWLSPPRRSLRTVAEVFRLLGRIDLARRYDELERGR